MATGKNKSASNNSAAKARTATAKSKIKKRNPTWRNLEWWRQRYVPVTFVAMFALVGAYLLYSTFAATTKVYLHMGTTGGACIAGTTIQKCVGSPAQTWNNLSGSSFHIENGLNQCLDDWNGKVHTSASDPNGYIHVAPCYAASDKNQQWHWSNSRLVNNASGGCLNAKGVNSGTGTPGTALIVYACNGGANEIWKETAASGGGTAAGGRVANVTPTGNQSKDVANAKNVAHCLLAGYNWNNTSQFNCLNNVYTPESKWIYNAGSTSYAYGIPQADPGNKMAAAGWTGGPMRRRRLNGGLRIFESKYGIPCGAWSHWRVYHSY